MCDYMLFKPRLVPYSYREYRIIILNMETFERNNVCILGCPWLPLVNFHSLSCKVKDRAYRNQVILQNHVTSVSIFQNYTKVNQTGICVNVAQTCKCSVVVIMRETIHQTTIHRTFFISYQSKVGSE
ncbi:hypothetical protein CEXT_713741 [Caerostris extrusa]|uniref:Uncharacterized protein n=1 Tax=Caerostris extrusa TaxID=172846 RepID=A0AAV4UB70_CAEEX|nr:hypothetical protein CEXT_713741 [Caerostris extrusa]